MEHSLTRAEKMSDEGTSSKGIWIAADSTSRAITTDRRAARRTR